MAIDNPWNGSLRQRLARLRIGRLIDRMSAIIVAGERAWQFARVLSRGEQKIYRGTYGFDVEPLKQIHDQRLAAGAWPRRFLYVGRYVEVKGLDVLVSAYQRYRSMVHDPWQLTCCGDGPMVNRLAGQDGIENRGWVQPAQLPQVLEQAGVFVIASWFEPWCVALAEAMASGLPAICSEAVGASVELVRSCCNGLTVPTRDVNRLADAMKWMHDRYHDLPAMGEQARRAARPFGSDFWSARVIRMFQQISEHRTQ
jgi:glycosyltransferase involved in cell wall biosynthesis